MNIYIDKVNFRLYYISVSKRNYDILLEVVTKLGE